MTDAKQHICPECKTPVSVKTCKQYQDDDSPIYYICPNCHHYIIQPRRER